jgi:predicted AlkP superfamily phosphohydrolase/phosphomutase
VFDVPYAPYFGEVNGIQVADWLPHATLHERPVSWPPGLIGELTEEFGRDPIGNCDFFEAAPDRLSALRTLLLDRIDTKRAAITRHLDKGGWDLFLTAFAESHCVGHHFWHLHDPGHPDHDPERARALGDVVVEVYRKLDSALGALLERAGPETRVVFYAGPGMQSNYGANYLLDRILRRLEADGAGGPARRSFVIDRLQWGWRRIPTRYRRLLQPLQKGVLASERGQRKAFAVPHNEVAGAVRINLAGREPQGRVQPGAAYDAYCEALSRDLMALVNLDSGEPAVERVVRTRELYDGDCLDDLPDLMVVWNRGSAIRRIGSPKLGEIGEPYGGRRSGDHTSQVLYMASGPGVRPGRLADGPKVEDLGCTLAAYAGVSLQDSDGRPIQALLPQEATAR